MAGATQIREGPGRRPTRRGLGLCRPAFLAVMALALAAAPALRAGEPPKEAEPASTPRPQKARGGDTARVIEIHVGIPGIAYLGEPLTELRQQFPKATFRPFANQDDAAVLTAAEAGISCYVVGTSPQDLRVASVGFVLDGSYEGAQEGGFRTHEGIGKGSTVNDLLETYGKPAGITRDRAATPALRMPGQKEDPNAPKQYHYASPDGKVKTYFVVEGSRVTRVVINDLEPLSSHLLKRSPQNESSP